MNRTEIKFHEMAKLQQQLNIVVAPDWLARGFAWHRAIYLEACEMMERLPWKWWKAAPVENVAQQRIELIDLIHFVLSWAIDKYKGDLRQAAEVIAIHFDDMARGGVDGTAIDHVEEIVESASSRNLHRTARNIAAACAHYKFGLEELYRTYVGKCVLNLFRQENGYKDGSYRKVWDRREDNEHLEEIMASGNGTPATQLPSAIQAALKERYGAVGTGSANA